MVSKIQPKEVSSYGQKDYFTPQEINRACSHLIMSEKVENEKIYQLFRFALSGNPLGIPAAEIAALLGQSETSHRLKLLLKELN